MKKSTTLLLLLLLVLTTILLSWNHNNLQPKLDNVSSNDDFYGLTDAEMSVYITDYEDQYLPPVTNPSPVAEDVLVQKIPGDNKHLLMMAFYSKENYSEPFVVLEDDATIIFRDDGKGYDKRAGDGLYTARIAENVNQFRQQAVNMLQEMKKNNYKPTRFFRSRKNL
jgi:hypothetical protein